LPGKIRPRNDLLCVEWDVKPGSTQTKTLVVVAVAVIIIVMKLY